MKECLLQTIRSEFENIDYTDIDVLNSFKYHLNEINAKDTNKIYVYKNTYLDDFTGCLKEVDRNDFATYSVYQDIETETFTIVPACECDYFEQTHRVIAGNLDKVRTEFIVNAIDKGQEYSVERLLKRRI